MLMWRSQVINGTKTKKGLTIKAKIDKRIYKKGKKVSDEEFKKINIEYIDNSDDCSNI